MLLRDTMLLLTVLGFGLACAAEPAGWQETEWKLPLDNWGEGRAWKTPGPEGREILLLARTKSGFCNCFTGVIDDTEIDRIGDVDLQGDNFTPEADGADTGIGDLKGRARLFSATGFLRRTRHVLSIVAATECKAVVATLVSDGTIPAEAKASAIDLLNGQSFRKWAANRQ